MRAVRRGRTQGVRRKNTMPSMDSTTANNGRMAGNTITNVIRVPTTR